MITCGIPCVSRPVLTQHDLRVLERRNLDKYVAKIDQGGRFGSYIDGGNPFITGRTRYINGVDVSGPLVHTTCTIANSSHAAIKTTTRDTEVVADTNIIQASPVCVNYR